MKILCVSLLLASLVAATRGMTCDDFYLSGQVPRCFSQGLPNLSPSQGNVLNRLISRSGVLRNRVTAPAGFHIEELRSQISTTDLGSLSAGALDDQEVYSTGRVRNREITYNPDQLPASSQCCGQTIFLYTWVRICANQGSACSSSTSVSKNAISLKCQRPCRTTPGGLVVPYSAQQQCPSCEAGGALPQCSAVCQISCSDSAAAVRSVMDTACEGPGGEERTCRCPDFAPLSQLDLSYCILDSYVAQTEEIKFGNLLGVYIKDVRSVNSDVDFENDVEDSLFCTVDAATDLEFKQGFLNTFVGTAISGRTLSYFDDNVVEGCEFENVLPGKNLFFRTGATLRNNEFGSIQVNSGSRIGFRLGRVCPSCQVRITNNDFGSIIAPSGCQLNSGVPSPIISGNTVDSTNFGSSAQSCNALNFP